MSETLYFISEVSRMVGVEAHVLRYWEEELELSIQRNSQGKRCYTEENVEILKRIKYWKDKGMQLKAVKEVMKGEIGETTSWQAGEGNTEVCFENEAAEFCEKEHWEGEKRVVKEKTGDQAHENEFTESLPCELVTIEEPSDSIKKLEQILDAMIGRALERNNEKLVREICDAILEELDDKLEFRMEELLQQELMKEMIREGEREAAASEEKRKKGLLQRWRKWLEKYI